MPKGCYRRFVILLAVPPHSSRQLLCPSPHFVHFFLATLDSASLHPLHSSSIHFSQVQYTRCQFFCARRPPHLGCFHLASAIAPVVPPDRKASLRFTCIVRPPSYPAGNILRWPPMELSIAPGTRGCLSSPFVGARRPPPFIRSSFSPAAVKRLAIAPPIGFRIPNTLVQCCRLLLRHITVEKMGE